LGTNWSRVGGVLGAYKLVVVVAVLALAGVVLYRHVRGAAPGEEATRNP
jgi:hypothetical protein